MVLPGDTEREQRDSEEEGNDEEALIPSEVHATVVVLIIFTAGLTVVSP